MFPGLVSETWKLGIVNYTVTVLAIKPKQRRLGEVSFGAAVWVVFLAFVLVACSLFCCVWLVALVGRRFCYLSVQE